MPRTLLTIAVAAAACGPPRPPPPPPSSSGATAFVDVTVVPMDRDGALPNHTVVVQGGAIIAIGPAATTKVPDGANRIDGRGKFLAPGLADMHAHTYDPRELALFVAHGVTTIRLLWGEPAAVGVREGVRADPWRLAPSIITAGPIVDGNPPVWPGSQGLDTVEQAVAAVDMQKRTGYDFVKVYSKLPADLYKAIVAQAAAVSLPVMGHVPSATGLAGALEAKQVTIEHLDGYAMFAQREDSPARKNPGDLAARIAAWKHVDPARLDDAVARTVAAGTWNCPTLVVRDRLGTLDKPPDTSRPEWKLVSKASIVRWNPANDFRFQQWKPEDFETARGGAAWGLTLVKKLSDAGAGLIAGTDVGNPWLVPGLSLHEELTLFVKAGLTPQQALRTATINAARVFAAEKQFGTIVVGARADVILLDADPLAEIANTQKLAGVMVRGRWLPREDLERMRREVAEVYDDKRSRFPDDAPPPNTQRAHYRERGPITGEERVTLEAGTGVAVGHVGGEVEIDGAAPQRWHVAMNGSALAVRGEGFEVTVRRAGTTAHVAARLGRDELHLEEQLGAKELLGGEAIASDLPFYAELMKLAVDETRTIEVAVLQVRFAPSFQHLVIGAKRLADGEARVGAATVKVRRFEYSTGTGPPTVVELDARGLPVATPTALRLR